LERELSDEALEILNEHFADIVAEGRIEKSPPLPEEKNEPELVHKPRLVFSYNHRSAGRLVEMIREINRLGSGTKVS